MSRLGLYTRGASAQPGIGRPYGGRRNPEGEAMAVAREHMRLPQDTTMPTTVEHRQGAWQRPPAIRTAGLVAWRHGRALPGSRAVPEETAVAFSYNRVAHAVMMASPTDLEDFAVGFSLNECIVATPQEIEEMAVVPSEHGIELRMWIAESRMGTLLMRRRHLAGATGCGLCGLESLDAALRMPPRVDSTLRITPYAVSSAMAALAPAQHLNQTTHAVHAAAFWLPGAGLVAVREDAGRHNALDKLAGGLARRNLDPGSGLLLLSSRISVELVQKAAIMGVEILAAISAPTALALRIAEQAGITLIGVTRDDGFEIFTHASRLIQGTVPHST